MSQTYYLPHPLEDKIEAVKEHISLVDWGHAIERHSIDEAIDLDIIESLDLGYMFENGDEAADHVTSAGETVHSVTKEDYRAALAAMGVLHDATTRTVVFQRVMDSAPPLGAPLLVLPADGSSPETLYYVPDKFREGDRWWLLRNQVVMDRVDDKDYWVPVVDLDVRAV